MSKFKRLKPELRKEAILAAALPLAERHGYDRLTKQTIADAVGCTGPLLNHHFGTVGQLRREIMRYAVKHGSLRVLAQGLVAKDPQAMKADAAVRRQALESVG